MKEKITMVTGEEVLWEGKANMFYRSSNPVVKIIMFFMKILMLIIGVRVTGTVVFTSQRVFFTYNKYFLWVFRYASGRVMIPNRRMSAISYGFEASFLVFFKTKVVSISSAGQPEVLLALKGISEEELNKQIGNLFHTLLIDKTTREQVAASK